MCCWRPVKIGRARLVSKHSGGRSFNVMRCDSIGNRSMFNYGAVLAPKLPHLTNVIDSEPAQYRIDDRDKDRVSAYLGNLPVERNVMPHE